MIKEHLVSASVTNGTECICNPEVLLGTKYGLWDFENELAPRGALLDLNAAWELFLSRKGFSNVSFDTYEHHKHEVIDGVVYEEGDTTYVLKDDNGNPTGATFTVKANKGPVEHIEWENGNLILYYTKQRPLTDKDLENGVPIHYVTDEDGTVIIDEETGKPLIYDYVIIPFMEIFDNDETKSLFPWFADEDGTVRLRTSIEGKDGTHLGRMAITPESEVFIAKETDSYDNVDLVSVQSVQKQLNKDLGFEPNLVPDNNHQSPDGQIHNYRADGSNLSDNLHEGFGDKKTLVGAVNEDLVRTRINTRLLADKIVESDLEWKNLLVFADSIKNHAFKNSTVPNVLAALNWMQTGEIGPFKEELNSNITKEITDDWGDTQRVTDDWGDTQRVTAENITEALNIIFEEAENNRDRIGYDRTNRKWIELNTDDNENLTDAINEVDQHNNALAAMVQLKEEWDPVKKQAYYSNPDLNNITKNRLRMAAINKDDVTVIEAINELQAEIGNLSSTKSGDSSVELTTNNKNTIVEAINEVDLHADNNAEVLGAIYPQDAEGKKTGDIANLNTENKKSIVAAINELDSRVGPLDELETEAKDNLVEAINETIKEQPFVYEDVDNPASGVVLKDQTEDSSETNHAGEHSLVVGTNNDIAKYSIASGSENIGMGDYTQINGYKNTSKKNYNNISGKSNFNDGNYNLVNGLSNTVNGSNNIVSGSNNVVTSDNSVILGDNIYAKNADDVIAAGNTINFKDNVKDSIALGKSSKVNGDKAVAIGTSNFVSEESVTIGHNNETEGPGNIAIGNNNYIGCDNSYTFGNSNKTEGDHTYVIGENNKVKGNNNYIVGKNQTTEGDNNVVIGNNGTVKTDNAIVIGEFNEPQNNSTNIGREIFIQTHNTESNLQKLIFVDLNDWCKKNNAASLNGEKFLDTQHLVNAIKVYKAKEYSDKALLRFTMQDDNENGYVLIQGKSTRVYLNGSWYFSDNIENGWSRHEGEYLKVINKTIIDSSGNQKVKHYLAFMDQLSTESIVDTVGGQRSNTEDFGTIDLTHAYGAVDIDDLETAMELESRFNGKVDKYARIITKYQDANGVYSEKYQNFINTDDPSVSNNITLSLKDSFGFDKFDYQLTAEKGKPNGYVPLDSTGLISSDFLPSYVDDVLDVWAEYEVDSLTKQLVNVHLYKLVEEITPSGEEVVSKGEPITVGEKGKIYVEAQPQAENHIAYQFRWTGKQFISIGAHIVIGETEGTAFDGARGKAVEDSLSDHKKSGTTVIPVLDELTGLQKVDEDGNPIWVVYKPNPHNVTAEQLPVVVNDPNDPNNTDMDDPYIREYNVDSAIKELFNRINEDEDKSGTIAAIIGTAEDIKKLDDLDDIEGNDAPTLISLALENKERLDSFVTIENSSIDNLVSDYFKL